MSYKIHDKTHELNTPHYQTSQLSQFHHETHGFGPLLTVSQSTYDFSLNSHSDPRKLISQSDCYAVCDIDILFMVFNYGFIINRRRLYCTFYKRCALAGV